MPTLVASLGRASRRLDPALMTILTVLAALAAVAPSQVEETLRFAVWSLLDALPFLLLSVAVAAYAKATGAENLIAKAFQGRTGTMVVFASLMGALSPFCSCGVIPLIAAMLSMGVPLPAVMAFWLASPLMDPSMFVMTAGTLGTGFAVAKTAAAIGIGLLGGFGTLALTGTGLFAEPLRAGIGNGGCAGSKIRNPKQVVWRFWAEEGRRSAFISGARDNLLFLGKWLTLAFVLESVMLAYVPADLVASLVGGSGPVPVMVATLVGIPAYLNGYAALPLVAGLIEQGMAPGVGMAFLVGGGVTSIPAMIAVFALARPPVFLAYLGFAVLGAIASGLLSGLVL
ncbi:MAG TPA: permease [Azospirillum sp.]|nr:permease [Azospirillum sp.]